MSALLFPMRKKQYWQAMGSRIRHNPDHLYDVWVEIARPSTPQEEPFVIQKFPEDYSDEEVLKTLPKFAFPCPDIECKNVDHFTFVITDVEAKYKFGFCRYSTRAETCMCIISCLPWYEIFYRLLNQLADIINRHCDNVVEPLLTAVQQYPLPIQADSKVQIIGQGAKESFNFTCPDPGLLPTIPENRNLTEYYIAVDPTNMILMFASLLYERRILVTSRKMSRLTACVHGSASLMYPMQWQHLYIPILPSHLLDYCSAPMPFIIGIHSSLLQKAKSGMDLGDVVILDADNNRVTTPHDDLATFPSDTISLLKKRLRALQSDKIQTQSEMSGDALARAFLRALVGLIGGYRDALKFREGEQITFDREAFVQSRPTSMHQFLEKILQLQIFEEFINDRLDLLNSGVGFSDEFEMEANDWCSDSAGKYNYWLGSMKKQGKKLKREGFEKLDGLKKKANPAVKSAVRNVKDKSKRAYKDLKSKIDDFKKPSSRSSSPNRPQTTIVVTEARNKSKSEDKRATDVSVVSVGHVQYFVSEDEDPVHYKLMCLDDLNITGRTPASNSEDRLGPERISFRLLDDPDIQTALKKSYSAEALCGEERKVSLAESESLSETSSPSYSPAHLSPLFSETANHSIEEFEATPRRPPSPLTGRSRTATAPQPMARQTLRTQAAMAPPITSPIAPPIPAPRKRPATSVMINDLESRPENQQQQQQHYQHQQQQQHYQQQQQQRQSVKHLTHLFDTTLVHDQNTVHPMVASNQSGHPMVASNQSGHPMVASHQFGHPMVTSNQSVHPMVASNQSGHPMVASHQSGHPMVASHQAGHPMVASNQSGHPMVASIHDEHHGNVNRLKAAYMGVEEEEERQPRIQRSQAFRTSTDRGTTQQSFIQQFDPLTGCHDNANNVSCEDEDLLKDWSLDFSFLNNSVSRRTPTPPAQAQPSVRRTNSSGGFRSLPPPANTTMTSTFLTEAPPPAATGTRADVFGDLCDVRKVRCDLNLQKWEKFE